jgi:hypothetical protein
MAVLALHPDESRTSRLRSPLLAVAVVGGLSLALHLRDPHTHGSWGFCPFKALTGWDCPGCGGLRAVNDLTDGHVGAAASSNLLLVASIPLLVGLWFLWFSRAWRGQPTRLTQARTNAIVGCYLVVAIGFAVLRNTPWGSWLHS